jgi:hypothetical protein
MAIEANEAYGRALTSLTRALQDPVEALKDTTLATTYVISLYEVRSTPGLPYIKFGNREADCPGTGYQWLPANRHSWIIITTAVECHYFAFVPAIN